MSDSSSEVRDESAPAISVREVVDGQTAAHLVVAADDFGWWADMLSGRRIRPSSGIEQVVAEGLWQCGLITPAAGDSAAGAEWALTSAGEKMARSRGFVRVVARGWEPTFRQLGTARHDAFIPARTDPMQVASAAAAIVERRPDILLRVAHAIASGTPGLTVDMGCADGKRIVGLAELAPREHFLGVDIAEGVIAAATADVARLGLSDRITFAAGSVQPGDSSTQWLDTVDRGAVTTAMSYLLVHQLATECGAIEDLLKAWAEWFPNLGRLVIGDALRLTAPTWSAEPWFSPSYRTYHAITGVRVWSESEYLAAFDSQGWDVIERLEDHTLLVTYILERR